MRYRFYLPGLLLGLFLIQSAKADEGMWIPMLLKQLNEADMQSKGLKLTAEDLYSINKSSLKDAVVQFGGGCTGELISGEGLLLTNHHCGYGQIQFHSSVQNDLIKNGFWSKNKSEELPNPGLTAMFIVRMEDVTKEVLGDMDENLSEIQREEKIRLKIPAIQKKAVERTHYEALIRPFFNGNQYYMFITETFKDVRLVGAPPYAIGNFGGDTDNWMWPRHTGDFSLFRIYAGADNKPAEYSVNNVPYKPKKHFTISLKGGKPGDFTMVYGFPGRTNEYLTSYAVDMIANYSNPVKVKIREARLNVLERDMQSNDTIRIKYAAKYAGVANAYKKWIGETRGLKKLNAVQKKQVFEQNFLASFSKPEDQALYAKLLSEAKSIYDSLTPYYLARDYFTEAILGIEILNYANSFSALTAKLKNKTLKKEDIDKQVEDLKRAAAAFFKNYNASTDKKVMAELLEIYSESNRAYQPQHFIDLQKKYNNDFSSIADHIFSKSIFTKQENVLKFLTASKIKLSKIEKDPAYQLSQSFITNYNQKVRPTLTRIEASTIKLHRLYTKGIMENNQGKKLYPDANSTLRVSYGQVKPYEPRNGVEYKTYTTIDGIIEKEDPTDPDFIVPQKLKELYTNKDFGRYIDENGNLRIAFIASNHTTGGNSGSPVLNGEGHLIGTNFDRNWEGTMSDIMYDPDRVRNITLDIRYTLFVIDKFAGAGYLLDEMTIVQ